VNAPAKSVQPVAGVFAENIGERRASPKAIFWKISTFQFNWRRDRIYSGPAGPGPSKAVSPIPPGFVGRRSGKHPELRRDRPEGLADGALLRFSRRFLFEVRLSARTRAAGSVVSAAEQSLVSFVGVCDAPEKGVGALCERSVLVQRTPIAVPPEEPGADFSVGCADPANPPTGYHGWLNEVGILRLRAGRE
jgi:hypothetical protein